ncbi:nucleotidyltransferase domain-containing protein [bacterium]|nr:nucleotidyltransferase domain-containing protein [bacterium]
MNILDIRNQYNLSQKEAASIINMPLRTFIRYEKDNSYGNEMKRQSIIRTLIEKNEITETKGLLTIDQIKESLTKLFDEKYKDQIEFCYLFGSYAKGYAKESSDIDLCIDTSLTGLKFTGLSESIREALHKNIDLIRFSNLDNNIELISEIMKDGIKIYG